MSVFLRISQKPYLVSGFATHDYAKRMRWVARTSAVVIKGCSGPFLTYSHNSTLFSLTVDDFYLLT